MDWIDLFYKKKCCTIVLKIYLFIKVHMKLREVYHVWFIEVLQDNSTYYSLIMLFLQVENVSASNDEGITALHNAICAGYYEIVTFLVEFGCDVNSPDSDGWYVLIALQITTYSFTTEVGTL